MSNKTENLEMVPSDNEIREPVDITPENTRFFRSGGGLVSAEVRYADSVLTVERISLVRAFPISNPDEYIAVREPGSARSDGAEIGMIRNLSDFDAETVKLLREELDRRYFVPEITKILSVKDKFGYLYFDAVTSAGKVTFVLNNPYSNFRRLENGSVLITDIDSNCFGIKNPDALDKASYKKIEVYL